MAIRYGKTETGQRVLKDRSVSLSPRQRSAFILFDGKRTVEDVLKATAAMGVTQGDVDELLSLGLLASGEGVPVSVATADAAPVAQAAPGTGRSPQQRYQDAYPIATRLTASLGLRGFRLNLAVEAATSYEQLRDLAPKIKESVAPEQYVLLEFALNG